MGYSHDIDGNPASSVIEGKCINTDEYLTFAKIPNELWLLSWGGPFDNCDAYCGQVIIKGTNPFLSKYGCPDQGCTLDSSTVSGWSSTDTHNLNITLDQDLNSPSSSGVSSSMGGGQSTNEIINFLEEKEEEMRIMLAALQEEKGETQTEETKEETKSQVLPKLTNNNETFIYLTLVIIIIALFIGYSYWIRTNNNHNNKKKKEDK